MYRGVLKAGAIALVAIFLVSLFVTMVVRWREAANRARCQDHLRQVGWFAMWSYTDRELAFPKGIDDPKRLLSLPADANVDLNRTFPPGTIANPVLPPEQRLSWMLLLVPYVGSENVQKEFDLGQGWSAEANHQGICNLIRPYVCPSQYQPVPPDTPNVTNYIGMAGIGRDAPTLMQSDPRAGFLR